MKNHTFKVFWINQFRSSQWSTAHLITACCITSTTLCMLAQKKGYSTNSNIIAMQVLLVHLCLRRSACCMTLPCFFEPSYNVCTVCTATRLLDELVWKNIYMYPVKVKKEPLFHDVSTKYVNTSSLWVQLKRHKECKDIMSAPSMTTAPIQMFLSNCHPL